MRLFLSWLPRRQSRHFKTSKDFMCVVMRRMLQAQYVKERFSWEFHGLITTKMGMGSVI